MCMTLFCLIMVWHGFLSCRKKIFTEASATFQDAISKEMNTRLGSIPIKTNRGALLLSDSISYEEKERWCDQDYLSLNDPNRIFLDSLFRARLADLGMETQTAVRCKRKEKTTISYTDSLFMKKATALKPVTQYMGLMGHPIADAYQSLMAERVEVLRGPASVLYGSNAMGGVINIVTRQLHEEGVKTNLNLGYGSFNTLQSEVTNRIRKGGFTSLISGSYNRTDGHRRNMGFEQYGGYAKLGYEFSPYWNIRGDVNVTHFNASQPGEVTDPMIDADQSITRGMTSVAVENRYERTSGAVSFFYNWGDHWINDGYTANPDDKNNPKPYRFDSHDDMMGISWYQSAQLFTGNRLTAGVDYYRFGGKAQNRYVEGERNGEREHIVDKVQHEIAGYIDFRQDISHWLTLDAGIRIDHHSHIGTEWIPQAGLSFHLPGSIELKASAGKGFRYPTIREMYMFPPKNPDLRPESMWNYELAFAQRLLDRRLSYGINVFYIDGKNLIVAVPRAGATPLNMNTGKIDNTGVEAEAAYRIHPHWSVETNYSYLHMDNPVLGAPEHKFYAGAMFSKNRWTVSTGLQYVANLYTDVDHVQTEDFVLWNINGSFKVTEWFDIWARGENLLAQRYEINAGYPMPKATIMAGINVKF